MKSMKILIVYSHFLDFFDRTGGMIFVTEG